MTIREVYIRCRNKLLHSIGLTFPYIKVRVWALRKEGYVIGNDVYFPADLTVTTNYVYNRGALEIGDRVAIGPKCIFVVTSHSNSSIVRTILPPKKPSIIIHHDAWLGAGVIVLSGVTIGEGSIIGAGAVVTKDVPAYTVSVGNPAKVIKTLSNESVD